jgi:predicted DNA-binding transcriptional regulator YafY
MLAGALHNFTNGSQTRRARFRAQQVLTTLRSRPGPLSAAALAQTHSVPLRTLQRTLNTLLADGLIARTHEATREGMVFLYRPVTP